MSGFVKIAIDDYYSDSNWTTIITKYWLLAERVSDPRVEGWMMFDSPMPTLALVLVYLSFVALAGPMWMSSRKPFRLQSVLVTYNAFQVLLSSYMFYEHLMSGWWGDYSLSCQPVDYSDNENARRMLHLCWVYYFSKLSEFADTVFFVLRKKKTQITWLHLYHHSLTPFEAWLLVKFVAGGHGTFSNIINNFVHVVMYGYYMVAAMGPQYHKYLWWKKHLTTVQLIQFFMVLFHSMSALFYDCGYPKLIAFGLVLHSIVFIVLFLNFYMHAYNKKDKPKRQIKTVNNNNDKTPENLKASEEATELNRHFEADDESKVYFKDKVSNGCIKNGYLKSSEEANGHIMTNDYLKNSDIDLCHLKNGDINALINNFKVNGEANGFVKNAHIQSIENDNHVQNGYTNGHIPKSTTDKKVQ